MVTKQKQKNWLGDYQREKKDMQQSNDNFLQNPFGHAASVVEPHEFVPIVEIQRLTIVNSAAFNAAGATGSSSESDAIKVGSAERDRTRLCVSFRDSIRPRSADGGESERER